jgi:hypothetical protein
VKWICCHGQCFLRSSGQTLRAVTGGQVPAIRAGVMGRHRPAVCRDPVMDSVASAMPVPRQACGSFAGPHSSGPHNPAGSDDRLSLRCPHAGEWRLRWDGHGRPALQDYLYSVDQSMADKDNEGGAIAAAPSGEPSNLRGVGRRLGGLNVKGSCGQACSGASCRSRTAVMIMMTVAPMAAPTRTGLSQPSQASGPIRYSASSGSNPHRPE